MVNSNDDLVDPSGREAVAASDRALASDPDLPSTGLLSFYDRLRERVAAAVAKRGGKLGSGAVEALMLIPDVFMLLARLALDRQVPKGERALIGGALAYFVLPLDLFPEAFVGGVGYVDDLVIACAVLAHAFGEDLEGFAERHWSGSQPIKKVLTDVSRTAGALLGEDLFSRVKGVLAKRGVAVPEDPAASDGS